MPFLAGASFAALTFAATQAPAAPPPLPMARVEACQIELTPVGAQARGGQVAVYDVVTNESGEVAHLKRRIVESREHMTALARLDQFEPCIRRWQFGSRGNFMVRLLAGSFWVIEVRRDSQLFRLEVPVARSVR